ncbi:hypothetical protein K0H61_06140 [Shewanella acanthi]|nr:hypothetical protein [Shewanella acanthi]QYJ80560.1 hypothetical protein K0H61_06140 [Shewanella acanthi]
MGSVHHGLPQIVDTIRAWKLHRDVSMAGIENRRRLHWRETEMKHREIIGRWLDERPLLGDKITLYREADKYYLETWFSDGCHSRDEVLLTDTPEGKKVEDVGGNMFGEFLMVTPALELQFCNDEGCFFQTDKRIADHQVSLSVA